MPDVRTRVITEIQTKGMREAEKLANSAVAAVEAQAKGFADLGRYSKASGQEVARLRGQLERLTRDQVILNRAMEGMAKGSDEWKDLSKRLKDVQSDADRVNRIFTQLNRTMESGNQKRRGFAQGLAQGVGVGQFLERGPGMRQQIAGQMVGRSLRGTYQQARGFAGAAGMTPFTGAQAMTQAAGAIPVVGAPLSAVLGRAMGQAQAAIGYEQTKMATMPYLGGVGMMQEQATAGRRAAGRAGLAPERKAYYRRRKTQAIRGNAPTLAAMKEGIDIAAGGTPEYEGAFKAPGWAKAIDRLISGPRQGEEDPGLLARVIGGAVGGQRTGGPISKEGRARAIEGAIKTGRTVSTRNIDNQRFLEERATKSKAAAQARAKVEREWLGNVGGIGARLGMNLTEVRQFAGQVSQAGGGYGRELRTQGMLPAAMGAQRMFGVGAGEAGAFLQAGRRGGLVGSRGRAGDALTEAVQEGLMLGLQGSEVTQYVQQIAGGIQQWRQTGIPMNKESLAGMGAELGTRGMGGVRAGAVSAGFQRAAEQVGASGPQSVEQLMMLQTMGGIKVGESSMGDIEDALIKLEEKQFTGKEMGKLIDQLVQAGGGGAEGRRVAYGALQRMGIQISRRELRDITAGPEGLTDAQKKQRAEIAKQQQAGVGVAGAIEEKGLAGLATRGTPGILKAQAALANKQISAGYKMVGTMQNLERMAQRLTNELANDIGPTLGKLTNSLDDFTKTFLANPGGALAPNLQVGPK